MIYSDIDYLNKNIHTSIHTCKALNINSLNDEIIKRGIENININTGLFGRWSLIGINPMIIFDSAHNESGFESIANQISKISFNKIHILLGFVKGKKINDLVRYLPKNSNIYFTSLKIERSMTHDEIKSSLTESVTFDNNPQRIFKKIKTEASKDDLILITGSNYLAKEIYNEN
jgi:dihydrofolate synthase/folylpolyglutamate synthase